MSDNLASALGKGHTIHHDGKTYTARLIVQKVKTGFQRWADERYLSTIASLEGMISDTEFKRRMSRAINEVVRGRHSFGKPEAKRLMETEDGLIALAAILFGIDAGEMLGLFLAKPEEVKAVIDAVTQESFPNG